MNLSLQVTFILGVYHNWRKLEQEVKKKKRLQGLLIYLQIMRKAKDCPKTTNCSGNLATFELGFLEAHYSVE